MIIALVGNQNCGKTTLFNQLTGANQHVGNFPGVTVEQKSGAVRGQKNCTVVDLPGIYSLRPFSAEELVTRDFVLHQHPDCILNIVDAVNPERNLYLTLQLMTLRIPMVLALNRMDEVRENGGCVFVEGLERALGLKAVPISALKGEGIGELTKQAVLAAREKTPPGVYDFCPQGPVHRCIHAVCHQIEDHAAQAGIPLRFAATRLIEGDEEIRDLLQLDENELEGIEHAVSQMENERGLDRNAALADMRYDFIEALCRENIVRAAETREHRRSVKIDTLLTDRYMAIPIFLTVMLLIFWLTFDVVGARLSDLLAAGIDALTELADRVLTDYGLNPVVHSLLIDGVFAGVGSVLSFLPVIVTLFFFLSILEDTGYMARVAFVMDQLLRKIGLSGKSIVPMLLGFGCTVPAVMATRTLSSDRDRKMTVLLTPFLSCSAKIPIYAFFTAAFFPHAKPLVMIALYVGGMAAGILCAGLLRHTVFRGNPIPFVMELPDYRFPSMKSVVLLLWEKAKDFLQRAFSVIFLASVIIWFLQTFDSRMNVVTDQTQSLLAAVGQILAPLFAPLGFGDWRCATALVSGFAAKESVVSTLEVLLAGASVQTLFSERSALSFLTFTLLYTPCAAAVAAIARELSSKAKTVLAVLWQCAVAWVAAYAVYLLAGVFV